MRYTPALLLIVFSGILAHAAKGPCKESAIKQGNLPVADDAFAYMPPYGMPVVGKSAIQTADTKSFSDRTNIQRAWLGDHRIVASRSGDMASEYGTVRMAYDSKSEGHKEFQAVTLSVYKAKGNVCQEVAFTMQPLPDQGKDQSKQSEQGKH